MAFSLFFVDDRRQKGNFAYMCCMLSRLRLKLLFLAFVSSMNIAVQCVECAVHLADMEIPMLFYQVNYGRSSSLLSDIL